MVHACNHGTNIKVSWKLMCRYNMIEVMCNLIDKTKNDTRKDDNIIIVIIQNFNNSKFYA